MFLSHLYVSLLHTWAGTQSNVVRHCLHHVRAREHIILTASNTIAGTRCINETKSTYTHTPSFFNLGLRQYGFSFVQGLSSSQAMPSGRSTHTESILSHGIRKIAMQAFRCWIDVTQAQARAAWRSTSLHTCAHASGRPCRTPCTRTFGE